MSAHAKARPLFDPAIVRSAVIDALRKLDPRIQVRNPVMFVVLVGSVLTTALFLEALFGQGDPRRNAAELCRAFAAGRGGTPRGRRTE